MTQLFATVMPRKAFLAAALAACALLLVLMLVAGVDAASAGQKFR